MKILITGYKGFIGQNMVEYLKPHHTVVGYEWGDVDYSLYGVDLVIHLGAISATTYTNTEQLLLQNYYFTQKLVTECNNKLIPIQIASSASVYGTENTTFKETDNPAPKNHYAWSKLLVEQFVINKTWNIPIHLFRYFNVYGDHEDHKGDQASPYHKFTKQAKENGVIKLFEGSDSFKRDFVPVQTICRYHERFFSVDETGIWNFGTGECQSFETVARIISKKYNSTIEYIPMPDNVKNSYQKFTQADMSFTHQTLKIYEA